MSGGADVGGVGGGPGPRFVSRELQELLEFDVLFLEGVKFLWGDAGRVALSSAHHLEGKASVYRGRRRRRSLTGAGELISTAGGR